jgi:hypothetical protein
MPKKMIKNQELMLVETNLDGREGREEIIFI